MKPSEGYESRCDACERMTRAGGEDDVRCEYARRTSGIYEKLEGCVG